MLVMTVPTVRLQRPFLGSSGVDLLGPSSRAARRTHWRELAEHRQTYRAPAASLDAQRAHHEQIRRGRGEGGVLMISHAVVVRLLTSNPYEAGTKRAGFSPDQARSALMCSASRMKSELRPVTIVRAEEY